MIFTIMLLLGADSVNAMHSYTNHENDLDSIAVLVS